MGTMLTKQYPHKGQNPLLYSVNTTRYSLWKTTSFRKISPVDKIIGRVRCSQARKRSTVIQNREVTVTYDDLLEEVKQLRAALSVYRHLVDRLTKQLTTEGAGSWN
jgi:hypothetical protein